MPIRLTGNSGSKLELAVENNIPVIIKSQGTKLDQDYQVLQELHRCHIQIPEYYSIGRDRVVMRYLDGLDIFTYISQGRDLDRLLDFLKHVLAVMEFNSVDTDLSSAIQEKLDSLVSIEPHLTFKLVDLYDRLPKVLPQGLYHGDLTLENIIYWNDDFYLIDANYTTLNSMAFDSAKLRQDSECLWFARNVFIDATVQDRIKYINAGIKEFNVYTKNNDLLIFMLMRVIPYCARDVDRKFLIEQINKLWI